MSAVINYTGALSMTRKVSLTCGLIAPLFYVATDILTGNLYPGYSFSAQAVSELFAIGAPTSRLVVPLLTVHSLVLTPCGFRKF